MANKAIMFQSLNLEYREFHVLKVSPWIYSLYDVFSDTNSDYSPQISLRRPQRKSHKLKLQRHLQVQLVLLLFNDKQFPTNIGTHPLCKMQSIDFELEFEILKSILKTYKFSHRHRNAL